MSLVRFLRSLVVLPVSSVQQISGKDRQISWSGLVVVRFGPVWSGLVWSGFAAKFHVAS